MYFRIGIRASLININDSGAITYELQGREQQIWLENYQKLLIMTSSKLLVKFISKL